MLIQGVGKDQRLDAALLDGLDELGILKPLFRIPNPESLIPNAVSVVPNPEPPMRRHRLTCVPGPESRLPYPVSRIRLRL